MAHKKVANDLTDSDKEFIELSNRLADLILKVSHSPEFFTALYTGVGSEALCALKEVLQDADDPDFRCPK